MSYGFSQSLPSDSSASSLYYFSRFFSYLVRSTLRKLITVRGEVNFEVKGVTISPDLVVRGKQATFNISASTGEMSLRKMDDKKHPREFAPEADLQGIQPLPSDFYQWKRYKVEDDRRGYSSKRGRRSAGMV